MQRWLDAVRALTYPNLDVLVVDNSTDDSLMRRWQDKVPMIHVTDADQVHAMLRITQSMEVIRQHFLAGPYTRWFNLEIDVIPPPDAIERMIWWGRDSDWIAHAYPTRGSYDTDDQQGIGCSLLSRRLLSDFNFSHAGDNMPDAWLWQQVRPSRKYRTIELWGYFPVGHLAV
jgi:hypothetical protein